MRISRIHADAPFASDQILKLEGEPSHYIRNVLRLRKGWQLTLFDGRGSECPAIVEGFERDITRLRLGTPLAVDRESPLAIHLVLGISRGERMDLAIQKAVELGVASITPVFTEHCVVRLDEDKKDTRYLHWERVIRSACEQSGRNRLPLLERPTALFSWLETQCAGGRFLILDPEAPKGLASVHPIAGRLILLIGPEGGFSDPERKAAQDSGFETVRMGPRVLRTETAVIAALSACQTMWGDLGV